MLKFEKKKSVAKRLTTVKNPSTHSVGNWVFHLQKVLSWKNLWIYISLYVATVLLSLVCHVARCLAYAHYDSTPPRNLPAFFFFWNIIFIVVFYNTVACKIDFVVCIHFIFCLYVFMVCLLSCSLLTGTSPLMIEPCSICYFSVLFYLHETVYSPILYAL